jgi:hypothetical protein
MLAVCWGCHMTWSWDPLTFGIFLFSRSKRIAAHGFLRHQGEMLMNKGKLTSTTFRCASACLFEDGSNRPIFQAKSDPLR